MKPKPIYLLPAFIFLLLAGFAAAIPGGRAGFLQLWSTVCILPVFFSSGWTRWAGVVLFGVFMGFAWLDTQDGKRYEQKEIARKLRFEEKRNTRESKGF